MVTIRVKYLLIITRLDLQLDVLNYFLLTASSHKLSIVLNFCLNGINNKTKVGFL